MAKDLMLLLAVLCIALHGVTAGAAAAAAAAAAPPTAAAGAKAAAAAAEETKGWFTGAAALKRQKRVIVIVGTAGSGTRNIHSLLAAAGVWMHPDTNKEFDSNIFIKRVKETPAFGMPGSKSGLIWETRNSPADYQLESLSSEVYNSLLQGHIQAAHELLAGVPDDVEVWGWKEPQAIFTLPFLYRVFPNLHVIHEVRDGRDVALSNLNSTNLRTTRKFQRYYIQTFAGKEYSDWQLRTHHFSKAAAAAWAQVNLNAKKWATENGWGMKGQYSITRLEDFCDPVSILAAIKTMFSNADVPFNDIRVRRAAAAIDPRKCETDRWLAAWEADDEVLAAAMRNIDSAIGGALLAFNYRTQSPLEMQRWLAAPEVMTGLREVALYAARAIPEWDGTVPPARPIILTEVSNGYEAVLENWLNWLDACGVDLTRVLIVTKGSSATAVKAIVDGMGPVVYEMPAMETPPITIMNKNDDPVLNTLWVERMRMLYEIVCAGVPVIMSDLDAIWFKDALSDIEARAAAQSGGFDMALSQGMWPPETYRVFKTSGCLGLAFFNATAGSKAVLRHMLHHAQRNMHIMFDDQQALNHQLVMANLAVNSTTPKSSGLQDEIVVGSQITTAPNPMRVLFLPHVQYQRFCDDATLKDAVVAHCRIRDVQNFKTPQMKQQVMKSMGLWKKETRDWLIPSPSPEPAATIVRSPDFWLPPAWIGTPPPLNPLACTPQLLIIAAPKAGTTAVYDYLNGTISGFTVHSEAVHFLNGSEASKQYVNDFRKLPEEKRRFHPRLAGSFLKEMHMFDGDINLIPDRLKQFPGINATLDDPLAGACSYEAAAFGLPAAVADQQQLRGQEQSGAAASGGVMADNADQKLNENAPADQPEQPASVSRPAESRTSAAGAVGSDGASLQHDASSTSNSEGLGPGNVAAAGGVEDAGMMSSDDAAVGAVQHDSTAMPPSSSSSSSSSTMELANPTPASNVKTDIDSSSSSNSQFGPSGVLGPTAGESVTNAGEFVAQIPSADDGSSSSTAYPGSSADSSSAAVLLNAPIVNARTLLQNSREVGTAAAGAEDASADVHGTTSEPAAATAAAAAPAETIVSKDVAAAGFASVASDGAVAAADAAGAASVTAGAVFDTASSSSSSSSSLDNTGAGTVSMGAVTAGEAASGEAGFAMPGEGAAATTTVSTNKDITSSSVEGATTATINDSSSSSAVVMADAASTIRPTSSTADSSSASADASTQLTPALVRFEATPAYLHTALAVTQLKELLPQARYLALLREPVSRVLSHFNMRIQGQPLLEGVVPANYSSGWADYMASEVERQMSTINRCKARVSRHSPVPAYTQLANCLFGLPVFRDINEYDLYKGLYDLHLERWFQHFSPEQTLIWSSRAFSLTPKQHLEQLVNWLGLDPAEINRDIDFVKIHERSYPGDQPLPTWLFQQLVDFYEPHKQATLVLLQRAGYVQLADQMTAAWDEELAYTKQKLVRPAAARR